MENQETPQFLKDAYCEIDSELDKIIDKFEFAFISTDYESLDDDGMIEAKRKEIFNKYFKQALETADSIAQKFVVHKQNKTETFDSLKEQFEAYIKKQKYRFEVRAGMDF